MPDSLPLLPDRSSLSQFADVGKVDDLVWRALVKPLEEFLSRPGKNLRGKLVELSCRLAQGDETKVPDEEAQRLCRTVGRMIEALHAGALIIDDIEDGSRVRRNAPTFHLQHGLPVALNAGNWLYFWALFQIQGMGLDAEREREMVRASQGVLLQAHFGQALDVGVRIDEVAQERVFDTCLTSIELKTGALTGLAMRLGGSAARGSSRTLDLLDATGRRFGVALQLFEDLGNFIAEAPGSPYCQDKRHEDLYLRRPSWVWAVASRRYSERDYRQFTEAVQRLPDESFLRPWVQLHDFVPTVRAEAAKMLEAAREAVRRDFGESHPKTTAELLDLMTVLEKAYG